MMKTIIPCLVAVCLAACTGGAGKTDEPVAYLFAYFTGNGPGQEAVHYALSDDGFDYKALNGNQPVIAADSISLRGGVRDPHILRGEDGKTFYMVLTDLYVPDDGWTNQGMVFLKSEDLIHWEHHTLHIPDLFPEEFGEVIRVWAPQSIYDPEEEKYMVYWSMKFEEGEDIIYYAYANADFSGLETVPEQLFEHPEGKSCIDGDIIYHGGEYHLFFKTEGHGNGIKKAVSKSLTSGYEMQDPYLQQTTEAVEGSGIFKLTGSDKYILMYDVYMKGAYQFTESTDLENFSIVDDQIQMDFHPRHGSVLPITAEERDALLEAYGTIEESAILGASGVPIKAINVVIDHESATVTLPVGKDEYLGSLSPEWKVFSGVTVSPSGAQDFSKGPVTYTISYPNAAQKEFEVEAVVHGNPVLEGYYADPEVLYSEKTGKYYIYPTSDGFEGWSGDYFKVFSSENLRDWKDEGVILDLKTQVDWTSRNAWAPCILETQIEGEYKYFYYFTAGQKIGVAVADEPTGPFEDIGQALVDYKPEGVNGGQEIDPDVFTDPTTGQDYLYWGNGYLAAVPLNDDKISFDKSKIKLLTPDDTFREGVEVFYREGLYYFLWSEDDTRSENYRVRYAFAETPMGPLTLPEDNLVIAKVPKKGIYGTGHNSVLKVHDKDEWYLVYHRFNRPNGIDMGWAAGYHREVCMDALNFGQNGEILPVTPTLEGISGL